MQKKKKSRHCLISQNSESPESVSPPPTPQDAADHSFVLTGETRIQPVLSVLYFPGFLVSLCRQRSGFSAFLSRETGEKGVFFGLGLCGFR